MRSFGQLGMISPAAVDRSIGGPLYRPLIMPGPGVSTLHPLGHYSRPVSAGAVNHVTLGELRTRAERPVQRPADHATAGSRET
jgi:hypothetical protein